MSGKGKDKTKRKDNIGFVNKRIDLKRLAYDVIHYTALKFHVPESCIAVWEGQSNDYGPNDFISVVCIPILKYQITYRHQYHASFSQHYEKNKLAKPNLVGGLLYEVINTVTRGFTLAPLEIVQISLSIACELFLFLYSKNVDMHPKTLATTWFRCYLNINKKYFSNKGGIGGMYLSGYSKRREVGFLNKFIEDHCLPYDTSATNPKLEKLFRHSANESRKARLSLSQKSTDETLEKLEHMSDLADQVMGLKIKTEPPAPDGATGFNPPESTGGTLGQGSQFWGSLAAPSQDLPGTSHEEQPWEHTILSTEKRRELLKSRYPYARAIRQLALASLDTEQSSDRKPSVSIATGTRQSYEHQGVRPKVPLQNTGSSGLQTGESSSRSSRKQSLRQLCSDSSERKQSSDQKPSVSIATGTTQSYEHQGVRPKNPLQNTGSSSLQTGESSSGSSRKQSRR